MREAFELLEEAKDLDRVWVRNQKFCEKKFACFKVNLRIMREYRGFTQKELARRANLSAHTISCYERGTFRPSVESLLLLERELGTTLNYLFNSCVSSCQ